MSAKLLCVDDNKLILKCYSFCAEKRGGFVVSTASSAKLALELEERHGPFDIIISDYFMPGMNGIDFLRQMKELRPASVRFLQSATAGLYDVHHAIAEGAVSRFFRKPMMVSEINSILDCAHAELLSRHGVNGIVSA
jgi:CheY-like chemotaxis protein